MNKILKWSLIVVGGLLGIVLLLFITAYVRSGRVMAQTFAVARHALLIPDDSISIASGEQLATINGCTECHGADLGGDEFINAPAFAVFPTPNLTAGEGGIGADYTAQDFERAIRHGIAKDGRGLRIMPSQDFHHLTDQDVSEIVAYVMSVPPVERNWEPGKFGPLGMVFMAALPNDFVAARTIDHDVEHSASIERSASLEYGEYLAVGCRGCHAEDLAGEAISFADDDDPPAANLTPDEATGLGSWTEEDFFRAMREGVRPDGTALDSLMPWRAFSKMTDDQLLAIWVYLRTLEPKPQGGDEG